MHLVTQEENGGITRLNISLIHQLCVLLLLTAMSTQEVPHIFNCTYLFDVKKKMYRLNSSQGFSPLLLLYFTSKQAFLFYDLFPLYLSLCLCPLCAQSSMFMVLTEPFPLQLLPLSSFPALYRLTFKGIIPTHLQLLF